MGSSFAPMSNPNFPATSPKSPPVRATGKVSLMVDDDEADRVCCEDAFTRLAPRVYVKRSASSDSTAG